MRACVIVLQPEYEPVLPFVLGVVAGMMFLIVFIVGGSAMQHLSKSKCYCTVHKRECGNNEVILSSKCLLPKNCKCANHSVNANPTEQGEHLSVSISDTLPSRSDDISSLRLQTSLRTDLHSL